MRGPHALMNSYHTLSRPFFFSYMRYSVRHASSLNLLVVSSSAMACCRTQYQRSEQGRRLSHTLLFYLVEVQSSTPNGKGRHYRSKGGVTRVPAPWTTRTGSRALTESSNTRSSVIIMCSGILNATSPAHNRACKGSVLPPILEAGHRAGESSSSRQRKQRTRLQRPRRNSYVQRLPTPLQVAHGHSLLLNAVFLTHHMQRVGRKLAGMRHGIGKLCLKQCSTPRSRH